jgi:hypothetical protein
MQPRSNKRQKELSRLEKRREKEAKMAERKREKAERPPWKEGDPDPSIEILPPVEEAAHPPDEPDPTQP